MSQDSPGPDSTSGSEWNQEQRGDVSLPSYLSVYDDPSASGDTIGDASRNRSSTPGKSKQEDDISRRRAALVPTTELDPSWIDIETIQIWINQCTYGHEKCERPLYSGGGPDWLIDTIDLCLVQTRHLPADVRYFALSYVWGQAESAELTKVAADAFQKPGVFAIGNTDVVIPKTIRQSMQLVTLLGERYLWVDRLCIAQDDKTHLHHQIHIMASIYHQAHVTIVAAAGWDCDEGFKGIKGISPPRQLAPNYADDYGKYLDLSNTIWVRKSSPIPSSYPPTYSKLSMCVCLGLKRLDVPRESLLPSQPHLLGSSRHLGMRQPRCRRRQHLGQHR